jgi:hypothetical protein
MDIFIGSSSEAKNRGTLLKIAHIVEEYDHRPRKWNDPDIFPLSVATFSALEELSKNVNAAILIFSEDDQIWHRGNALPKVRDNVLLEYGLFAGALGSSRVILVREGQPGIPSDLAGITYAEMSKPVLAEMKIKHWLDEIAPRKRTRRPQESDLKTARLLVLDKMKRMNINDPNLDLLLAIYRNDSELAKVAIDRGGHPNVDFWELFDNHNYSLRNHPEYSGLIDLITRVMMLQAQR